MAKTSPSEREQRAKIAATRATLVERFPLCFSPKGADKRPLATGIKRTLVAVCPDLDPSDIKLALRDYCFGPTYQRNVVVEAVRIDLQGNAAGTVTEGQAEYAAGRMRYLVKMTAAGKAKQQMCTQEAAE